MKRIGGKGARNVLDVVVSWPGITVHEVADELGVTLSTARTYVTHARRAGWMHAGAVPRLVDIGARFEPDWNAAKSTCYLYAAVYRRICRRYTCDLSSRREDLLEYGWSGRQLTDAVYRLREIGAVQPRGNLYATDAGQRVAFARGAA